MKATEMFPNRHPGESIVVAMPACQELSKKLVVAPVATEGDPLPAVIAVAACTPEGLKEVGDYEDAAAFRMPACPSCCASQALQVFVVDSGFLAAGKTAFCYRHCAGGV